MRDHDDSKSRYLWHRVRTSFEDIAALVVDVSQRAGALAARIWSRTKQVRARTWTIIAAIAVLVGLVADLPKLPELVTDLLHRSPPNSAGTDSSLSPDQNNSNLVIAAERVEHCIEAHRLSDERAVREEILYSPPTILGLHAGDILTRRTFENCQWPPSSYSDADGYVRIVVEEVVGPGKSEATFASYVDRVFSDCQVLELSYMFGKQGVSGHSSFEVPAGSIVDGHGDPWDSTVLLEDSDQYELWLGFYTRKGEVTVIRNASISLEDVKCTS
jgi:hypothetical protein